MQRSSAAFPPYAKKAWRQRISAACAAHAGLGPASLVPYDVSTLYFETGEGDGFRESGFSKERRLEPQITIGLLTGQDGFPLMVAAFEGNKAETKTMLPVIEALMAAHDLPDVTVVADAGMVSEANQKQIEAAGLSFILGRSRTSLMRSASGQRPRHDTAATAQAGPVPVTCSSGLPSCRWTRPAPTRQRSTSQPPVKQSPPDVAGRVPAHRRPTYVPALRTLVLSAIGIWLVD